MADDMGYADLGCYGQSHILTPRLDAMAKDSLKFMQAYSGSTVCAPSRCCLMTGRQPGTGPSVRTRSRTCRCCGTR